MRARGLALIVTGAAIAVALAVAAGGGRDQRVSASADPGGASPGAAPTSIPSAGDAGAASDRAAVPDPGPAARAPELLARPGKVVARGAQYVIEDVPLDAPATVTVAGQTQTATSVLRITITAGPFAVRDAAAIVSLGGAPLGIGAESSDLSALVCLTFDRSVLTDGATLSYGYGLPNAAPQTWSAPVTVIR
jgi:hypothetical protein